MVLDLEINGITRTERCIRSQNNDGPRFRRDTGSKKITLASNKGQNYLQNTYLCQTIICHRCISQIF